MNRNNWFYIGATLLFCLLAFSLYLIRSITIPFLLALLLAYFLDPAVDALERRRFSRGLSILIVFTAFAAASAMLATYLVPSVEAEFFALKKALPSYAEGIYRLLPNAVLEWLGIVGNQDLQTFLNRFIQGAQNLSFEVVNQVLQFLSGAFTSTFSFIVAVLGYFIIPIYLFYLLKDFDRFKEGALSLIPPRHQSQVIAVSGEIDCVLGGFIRGQLTVCLTLALLYSSGLALIGIDLALFIGILAGLAFIIPYLGTILGICMAVTMAAVKFHDLLHPLMVIGLFGVVQVLEGVIITPRFVGNRVGLHPLATILAVLVGGELFGFLGLLLAVPVAASGNVVVRHLIQHYLQTRFYDDGNL